MNWLLEKYDWFIYWRFWKTINRMVRRRPGFAYLMQLQLEEYLKANPISDSLKNATERFHETLPKPTDCI